MAIDSSIALGVKPYQQQDPISQYAAIMGIQSAQQANQMNGMKMDEYQRGLADETQLRDLTRQAGGDTKKLRDMLFGAGNYKQGMALDKAATEQATAKATLEKTNLEANHKRLETAGQAFGQVRANPTLETANSVLDYLGQNNIFPPEQIAQYKAQVAANPQGIAQMADLMFRATLSAKDQLAKTETRNTGSKTDTLSIDPVTGKTAVINSVANTQSPDSAASVAATIRGQNLTDARAREAFNAPQYMETDAGLVALPKKLAAGQVPTGTPVMGADGQPLGKPLKPIPATANSGIIQNTQSINNIDRALTLLGGKNIGDPKAGGMQGDAAATGLKGYLPNGLLNRVDPKGVDARAEISDIGSLKIHDRSGAAVTISEAPRLLPFIPLATDDDATVVKKLNRLKIALQSESQALQETYSKENGYKPSAVKPVATSAAPAAPIPAGWNVKAH
ncbi:MAG: hypothetical protein HYX42_04010 [Polaromonas sp.]|uniref:hypothetical protein n=1 Tax=Polaromonas sp. TaxID=1869339 RepID=UPI0025EC9C9B|nr:hypothetical protein [Polaromonas sp.]MBI2725395.1 hypothetical protein [Polaromonas sp.]